MESFYTLTAGITLKEGENTTRKVRKIKRAPYRLEPALTQNHNENEQRLRCLLHFLFQEFRDDLVDHLIGEGADFLLRLRLNRVLHEDWFILGHAER